MGRRTGAEKGLRINPFHWPWKRKAGDHKVTSSVAVEGTKWQQNDVQCDRIRVGKAEELLKGGDQDEEGSTEDNEARHTEELQGQYRLAAANL